MELSCYTEMFKQQQNHWWFRGRRLVIKKLLDETLSDTNSSIIEVGCGVGGNLELLGNYGTVTAIEMNDEAVKLARTVTDIKIIKGSLPYEYPFSNDAFDVVCLFDVLEHIEEDVDALKVLYDSLKNNGKILITVPSIPQLFGPHDIKLHHFRRYKIDDLVKKVESSGFKVVHKQYFNFLLLPLAVLTRFFDKVTRRVTPTGSSPPNELLNSFLFHIFRFETWLLKFVPAPLGLSISLIAKKTSNDEKKELNR
ncbi:class I SAM-dependent methyltransferase [Thalassotalea ponticola]|uniref:class I SAM-dependent methyltransferase n=1 Tax=Thalassotalea ponticola TaxID=1523392 RepID=UPI0025B38B87|nr:class I SAM-dependent methyltransferase [Thalassotalea ponticola]MDN3651740.1 class I SAM-dependent methyltransferase [Thalassotalea ponticola]